MSKKFFAAPFASLMGIGARAARAESDDEKEKDAKGARAEDDEKEDDEKAKGARVEDDNDGADAEKEDGDDGSTDAKGARAEDEEDDDAAKASDDAAEDEDGDDGKDEKAKKAAKAERARCARILSHGFKCGRAQEAAVLAFDSGMSSASAISMLNATGAVSKQKPQGSTLRDRMGAEPASTKVKGEKSASALTPAQRIIEAGKKRRGEQ